MECNLVWNHTRDFNIERARSASSIWNHKYDFRPKLHERKIFRFLCICSSSRFVENSGTGNAFTSHLACKTMSCDENSFEHDKETSSSEIRTKIVYFRYKSSTLVDWINYGKPSFLLRLRLTLFIVFGAGIWRCISCVILQSISFELWNSLECTMPSG